MLLRLAESDRVEDLTLAAFTQRKLQVVLADDAAGDDLETFAVKQRTWVALAIGLECFDVLHRRWRQCLEIQPGVEEEVGNECVLGRRRGDRLFESLRERVEAFDPDRQSGRHAMAAIALEQIRAAAKRFEQMHGRDPSRRAASNLAFDRQ